MSSRHALSFASGAVVSLALAYSVVWYITALQQSSGRKSADERSERARGERGGDLSRADQRRECPAEIQEELQSRVRTFFGDENFEKLKGALVVVVGLGGVGSHAANMLVRSGVRKIRLIDFDQVTLSSLNRHAVAAMEDVGKSKAETMKKRLLQVVPWADVDAVTAMYKGTDSEALLAGEPDYVLDCIDDVSTKAELIAYCVKNNIKVLTSMGAGGKSDPTRIRIAALADCVHDPLASKIKWKLKKHGVSCEDVMSIFSIEKPTSNLLPLGDEQAAAPPDFGVADYLRLRVMPVLGTSPSIFGQGMASYVLCALAGRLYAPEGTERLSKNHKHRLKQTFRNYELRRFKTTEDVDLDDEDVEFIVQIVWRSKCAVTGKKFGGSRPLLLTRWDPALPPTPYNIVLMLEPRALKMEEEGVHAAFTGEVIDKINARLQWAKGQCEGFWRGEGREDDTPSAGREGGSKFGDSVHTGERGSAAAVAKSVVLSGAFFAAGFAVAVTFKS